MALTSRQVDDALLDHLDGTRGSHTIPLGSIDYEWGQHLYRDTIHTMEVALVVATLLMPWLQHCPDRISEGYQIVELPLGVTLLEATPTPGQ